MGGADKGALIVGGQTILDRQMAVLRPLVTRLLLVDRDGRREAPDGAAVVADRVPDAGVLGGIVTALEAAETDRVLVVACDMPFITTALVTVLLDRLGDADAAIVRDRRGRHALCAVFHRRTAPVLRTQIARGQLRVDDTLTRLRVQTIDGATLAALDADGHLLDNVNTPEDYRDAVRGYDTP
jgi:molybdopterin-guanine dinucleotide biosynthesis protein A